MARDIVVPGECLVRVALPYFVDELTDDNKIAELGLALSDSIIIRPQWRHKEIYVDSYGPEVPAELMSRLASVEISMTLVHFDKTVVDICIGEATGGQQINLSDEPLNFGDLQPAGTLMGNNLPLYTSGNHYIGLNLLVSGVNPYFFPSSYLTDRPLDIPIGTSRQLIRLNWRAIPYGRMNSSGAVSSSGSILWTRVDDFLEEVEEDE